MFGIILDETKKMAQEPWQLLQEILRPRRWRQFFGILFFNARAANRWKTATEAANRCSEREYSSYEDYLAHQKSKFRRLDLAEYDRNYGRVLIERLQKLPKR